LQISTLLPSNLGPVIRYPRSKELTDDEEEQASSPIRKRKDPAAAEDAGPSHKGPTVDEYVATEHREVCGSGGRMRGVGRKILSRHPTPALRAEIDVIPESAATIQLPKRK
jgi:hypothetical protein